MVRRNAPTRGVMKDILIVEDEEVIRSSLRQLLERHNYRVRDAVSVKSACQAYNLKDFALIISDLRLPGGTGNELIGLAPEVPVIIMTSYASLRSAVDNMRQGAVDYISKPFDHDEMIVAVKRAIGDIDAPPLDPSLQISGRQFAQDLSLQEYFTQFVLEHQGQMSETALAKKLGISRKSLWQRRFKLGICRRG